MTKVLTFFLPQFHRIPENDEWWGEGFTEWTTVKNAKPLFPGHDQPQKPLKYYNLLEKEVMKEQAELMHTYGVDGMCFYHYYFKNGKKVLEKPAENLLKWKDIDMPFCFYWANESWIRSWSNIQNGNSWSEIYDSDMRSGDGILLEQDYGERKQWEEHFYYLLPFFNDSRYIKKNNRPVFMILHPEDIDCLTEMMDCWNDLMEKEGLPDIYFIGNGSLLDGTLSHEPASAVAKYSSERFNNTYGLNNIIAYDDLWKTLLQNYSYDANFFFCGFVGYDDTPRHGKRGTVITEATPEKFKKYLIRLLTKAEKGKSEFVFINAWNEWGEGMYLEPDMKWGTGYLEALKDARRFVDENCEILVGIVDDNIEGAIKKGEIQVSDKEKRYKEYWQVLDKWLKFELTGKSIARYLKEQSYNSVAIYGLGMLGTSLVMDLKRGGVDIKYGIDQDVYKGRQFDFPVYTLEDELPDVSIIIVTTTIIFSSIKEKLSCRCNARIISINSIFVL